MRRTRSTFASFIIAATLLAHQGPALAQMAVVDHANLAQTTLAASRAFSELQQLTAQYNQLVATYQMLTNPVDVASMATGLNVASLQNPLPSTSTLGNLVVGSSPAQGLGASFYNQNHIYSPTDGSASSTQLVANGNAIANLQGLAATNLQAIQQRLGLLPLLQTSLAGAQSITEVDAINGRIALEANYIQAQQAQAQNLALLAQQQNNSQLQQERERFVKDMTDGEAEMKAAAVANGGQ